MVLTQHAATLFTEEVDVASARRPKRLRPLVAIYAMLAAAAISSIAFVLNRQPRIITLGAVVTDVEGYPSLRAEQVEVLDESGEVVQTIAASERGYLMTPRRVADLLDEHSVDGRVHLRTTDADGSGGLVTILASPTADEREFVDELAKEGSNLVALPSARPIRFRHREVQYALLPIGSGPRLVEGDGCPRVAGEWFLLVGMKGVPTRSPPAAVLTDDGHAHPFQAVPPRCSSKATALPDRVVGAAIVPLRAQGLSLRVGDETHRLR